jgi:LysR family transcriptional regulator, low CO2-responsive transcriptional regulator
MPRRTLPPAPAPAFQLDQLIAFARVAAEGSFSRAALALGIGQPAISTRISALERALGGALFHRGRRLSLTVMGEAFIPYVRRGLEILTEGAAGAQLAQEGRGGRITLATLGSLAVGLVGPALRALLRAHADVACLVKAGDHEVVLRFLLDGVVELALVAWPCAPALEPELHALFVLEEPVVLVAPRRHALTRRKTVSISDVTGCGAPVFRLRWWPAHHPAIDQLAEASGGALELPMETARHLVRARAGIAFFPRSFVAEDLGRGELVEIRVRDLPAISRPCALVRRLRGPALGPVALKFVDLLRAEALRIGLRPVGRGASGR